MAFARSLLNNSKLCNLFDFTNISKAGCLENLGFSISVRTSKHWDPKFKWYRTKKYIPVELPHTEEAKRRRRNVFKEMGLFPRYWKPRPLTITTSSDIIDPYVPVVGDGKATFLSKGIKSLSTPKSQVLNATAMRKIKNYDFNFQKEFFVQHAQDIYIKAHKTLMKNDLDELSQFVTEKSLVEMTDGLKNKTLKWEFIESLEPPVIVQARAQEVLLKTNFFAQLTVRFHTKQTLAIYDRFGRLIFGSEILAKDVLEYVVFEKHISNEYGVWRLHGKIIPEWQQPSIDNTRTYRIDVEEEEDEEEILFDEKDPECDPDLESTSTAEIVQSDVKPPK